MTKEEFTQRTLVEVDDYEFNAIQTVYLSSDLDKDEFCKLWKKLNPRRVKNAKVERILSQREQANRDFAWRLVNSSYTHDELMKFATDYFTWYEQNFLETRLHISMEDESYMVPHTVAGILGKLNKYLFE